MLPSSNRQNCVVFCRNSTDTFGTIIYLSGTEHASTQIYHIPSTSVCVTEYTSPPRHPSFVPRATRNCWFSSYIRLCVVDLRAAAAHLLISGSIVFCVTQKTHTRHTLVWHWFAYIITPGPADTPKARTQHKSCVHMSMYL